MLQEDGSRLDRRHDCHRPFRAAEKWRTCVSAHSERISFKACMGRSLLGVSRVAYTDSRLDHSDPENVYGFVLHSHIVNLSSALITVHSEWQAAVVSWRYRVHPGHVLSCLVDT